MEEIIQKSFVLWKLNSKTIISRLFYDKISNIEEYKSYLIDIIDLVPSTSSVGLYIDVVEEKAVERRILANMQELSSDILTSKYDFNTVLDRAEDTILKVIKKRRTSNFMTMAEAAKKVYEQIEGYVGNKSDLTGLIKLLLPIYEQAYQEKKARKSALNNLMEN